MNADCLRPRYLLNLFHFSVLSFRTVYLLTILTHYERPTEIPSQWCVFAFSARLSPALIKVFVFIVGRLIVSSPD